MLSFFAFFYSQDGSVQIKKFPIYKLVNVSCSPVGTSYFIDVL